MRVTSKAKLKGAVARRAATAHRLSYVSDAIPGIHRQRRGKTFFYTDATGRLIKNKRTLARIRSLAIPPAYQNVWICKHEFGHLQATGIDGRGRKQYRYHPKWRSIRDAHKFDRMRAFGKHLPTLRRQLNRDLHLPGLPLSKVLALLVTLLEKTMVRIGNVDYVRQNNSFGLTTLRDRHITFLRTGRARLKFKGKSHKEQSIELADRELVTILRKCHDLPGQQLFQYVDENGAHQPVDSGMVNEYLLEVMGAAPDGTGFTAKDFRTWGATLHAIKLCAALTPPAITQAAQHRHIVEVCKTVAEGLGNTPAICRKSYINPWVFAAWSQNIKPQLSSNRSVTTLTPRSFEKYALRLLQLQTRHAEQMTGKRASHAMHLTI